MEASINPHRKIGIEIEVVVPIIGRGENFDVQQILANILTNEGIQAFSRSYTRRPLPPDCRFAIEHDASLQDESRYQGLRWSKIEAKTAPMVWEEVERFLPPALEIIRYVGARCNASTGLHVHHHLPEIKENPLVVRNLQHLWWRFHPVMYGLVAPGRISNMYCRPPRGDDAKLFDDLATYDLLAALAGRTDRYQGLNFTSLSDRDRMTVEWRIHGGTTDWPKIKAWVLATQRWVEHAVIRNCHYKPTPVANTLAGLNALFTTTGLKGNSRIYRKVDKDLRQAARFLWRRWRHFNLPRKLKAESVAA